MSKLEIIRNNMKKKKTDLLILQTAPNIRYFLDVYDIEFSGLICIPLDNDPFVLSSVFEKPEMEKSGFETMSVSSKLKADIKSKSMLKTLKKLLDERKISHKRISLEKSDMNVKAYEAFNKVFDKKVVDFSEQMLKIRSIKTEEEITRLKRAAELTVKGMMAVREAIKPGVTERELARTFEYEVRKRADWYSFETIVSCGKNSAEPHHLVTDYKIKKNDFVLVDCGVIYKNMHSDMTRTFCLNSSDKQRKIYNIVLEAQTRAIEKIKINSKASAIDAAAREVIDKAGYGDNFTHSLGHGVGIEIHESPSLSTKSKDVLRENMVFTVEPGIYIKGFGGVRIEDTVLLNKKGVEILTKYPRKL